MGLDFRTVANLNCFPQVLPDRSKHVSMGDMHGNALRLIYILIEEGVIKLDSRRYNTLRSIYTTPAFGLTQGQLAKFKAIIEAAEINTEKAVVLIGDELADRGSNDYFTLLVFKKLHDSQLNFEIILSNHGAEFIRDFEKKEFTGIPRFLGNQGQSLTNMHVLIKGGLIQEKEVRDIVEHCYKPRVKAISYTLSEKGELTLFTHAPVGLETVRGLANKFNLLYDDRSLKQLIRTIDTINNKIECLLSERKLSVFIDEEGYVGPDYPIPPYKQPLQRLFWNRVIGNELITKTSGGVPVNFVHGHIGDEAIRREGKVLSSHQNLDNSWGKAPLLFNLAKTYKCKHFTRHSNDFTALDLTDNILDALSAKGLFVDDSRGTSNYESKQLEAHIQFNFLLNDLKIKRDKLVEKSKKNSNYDKAASEAIRLCNTLSDAAHTFFNAELTPEGFITFKRTIDRSVQRAIPEFEKHRSIWNGTNPLIKFVKAAMGVLSVLLAGMPALAVGLGMKKGFQNTFFKIPSTDSAEKLKLFEEGANEVLSKLEVSNECFYR